MKQFLEPKNLFFIALGLVILMPFLLTIHSSSVFDFSNTGQIGDTIGGIAAPIIGLLSAWLVYKSFQAQIEANNELKRQIAKSHEETNFVFISNELRDIEKKFLSFSYNNLSGKNAIDNFIQNLDTHLNIRETIKDEDLSAYDVYIKMYEDAAYRFDVLLFHHGVFITQLQKLTLSTEHKDIVCSKYFYYYKINLASLYSVFDKYLVLKNKRTLYDNELINHLDRLADISKRLKEWSEKFEPKAPAQETKKGEQSEAK